MWQTTVSHPSSKKEKLTEKHTHKKCWYLWQITLISEKDSILKTYIHIYFNIYSNKYIFSDSLWFKVSRYCTDEYIAPETKITSSKLKKDPRWIQRRERVAYSGILWVLTKTPRKGWEVNKEDISLTEDVYLWPTTNMQIMECLSKKTENWRTLDTQTSGIEN